MKYKANKKNKYIKKKLYNSDDKALIIYEEFKDEKKVNEWIMAELRAEVEDLKKDVKKIFDDIIKVLDFIEDYEKQSAKKITKKLY